MGVVISSRWRGVRSTAGARNEVGGVDRSAVVSERLVGEGAIGSRNMKQSDGGRGCVAAKGAEQR